MFLKKSPFKKNIFKSITSKKGKTTIKKKQQLHKTCYEF